MKVIHSPACQRKLADWFREPYDSMPRRLASFAYDHTDLEIRDLLLTIFDEDPADSDAAVAARELWPLLLLREPLHSPEELRDELDSLAGEYVALKQRTEALAARFRALEPWSEMWNRYPHDDPEFGGLNIDWTARGLGAAASMLGGFVAESIEDARGYAAKIRVYDESEAAVQ
ncbi:hypothetical protein [Nocardia abscessus]|uniref:hypothetical protein n=1 Tax=Nocardia abscessus TaxID=120957 RepID=UPI00030839CA|nr:hypothetical protein [Nocardia abscessus]MCC3333526.1 hypothetical protein [Nocardia abscessus]